MRIAMVVPAAALLVLLGTAPALADPPVAPLPALPGALAAALSPQEAHSLATLTAGDGVGLDAVVRTPAGASVVRLDTSTTSAARQAVSLLDAQPGVRAGLTGMVRATGSAVGLTSVRALSADPGWDLLKVRGPDAQSLVAASLPSVTVAVLDTGIAPNPQLTPVLVPGQNFSDSDPTNPTDTMDNDFHGTHVAGTIGANVGATGIEGVADGVRLMPVKVLDDTGSGTTSSIASGIIWAADNGADVINMSLGGDADAAVDSAIDYARSKGVVVVAAAGNEGDQGNPVEYPGASPGVIGVAATDEGDARATFSEYGPQVDVAAPGVDVASLYLSSTDSVAIASGTSMATPHVAAVAALVKAVDRSFTPDQVQDIIQGAVIDLGSLGRDDYYGHGRVDALAAVEDAFAADGQAVPVPASQTPIDALYRQLGGSAGFLGLPRTAPFGPLARGGSGQHFQGGSIYWSSATGAHVVKGAIRDRWSAGHWENGFLGYPTTDAFCGLRNGGCGQHFQGGSIYWNSATGARIVNGAIRNRWAATGWENGVLGYPTTDAFCGLRNGGCGQHFQGGSIYWNPATGAHVVSSAIRTRWAASRWENGILGYPTTEAFCGLRNGGCGQHFQGGSIYWSPTTGARLVNGAIRNQWAATGWENGFLGYPTTEAYGVSGGVAMRFQHGVITWVQATGRTWIARF